MADKRSAEARRRRAPARARAIAQSGRRVACDRCKILHPPPECPPDSESVALTVMLPPWLQTRLAERVAKGERSPWVVRLIRKELEL